MTEHISLTKVATEHISLIKLSNPNDAKRCLNCGLHETEHNPQGCMHMTQPNLYPILFGEDECAQSYAISQVDYKKLKALGCFE